MSMPKALHAVTLALLGWACVPVSRAVAAPAEVRGTWITTTSHTSSTNVLFSSTTAATTNKRLRDIGLNTIYMDIWRNGNTYYNSPTNAAITGNLRDPATMTTGNNRDYLQEAVINGHRNRMAVFGWFQYGLAAGFSTPSNSNTVVSGYMKNNGWLLQDAAGNYNISSRGNFTWMNPLVPQVQTYVTNLLLDAVRNYNLNGIQLDDHFAWPVEFGYDAYTRAQYLSEMGVAVPTNASDPTFMAWRSGKVTALVKNVIASLRAAKPNLIISVSPSVYSFSYDNYLTDWTALKKNSNNTALVANPTGWATQGLFDEYIPQVYRGNSTDFNRDWIGTTSPRVFGQTEVMPGTHKADLAAGIAINTSGPPTWASISAEIQASRGTSGYAGHSIWFVDGVLTNETNLTGLYNVAGLGQADRPDLAAASLPAPIVGTLLSGTTWQFNTGTAAGFYDLISSFDGNTWTVRQSNVLILGGTYTFNVTGAGRTELLFNSSFSVIPEPSTMIFGLVAAGALGRRPRTARAS